MANKAISELPQAQNVNNQDLFVLEQSGIAKKLTAETFITEQGIIDALAEALDGHGGIQSVTLSSVSGRIRTYLITFTDGSATTFQVFDGTSIDRIAKTSTAGLVDTYTIFMSDGTTSFFTVSNGADGTVSEAMLNDALKDKAPAVTETTESSTIANFTDGADDMAMHNVVVEINPVQDLTYGDPYPAGGSANIWDEETENGYISSSGALTSYTNAIRSANYCACVPSTSYYFHTPSEMGGCAIAWYDADKTFIQRDGDRKNSVVTAPSNAYYFKLSLYNYKSSYASYSNNVALNYPSSETSYSPYSNICPITGWTGVNVTRTGINVWDEEWENGFYSRATGEKAGNSDTTYFRSKNYIPCAPNTSYYFKAPSVHASNNTYYAVLFYDADKSYISAINSGVGNTARTTPQNAQFMTLFIEIGTSGATYQHDISINYPSTDHDYHAYQGNTVTLSWQTEAGTVCGGTIDVATGLLTVDMAKYSITADILSGIINKEGNLWRVYLNSPLYGENNAYKIGLCNIYTFKDSYTMVNNNNNSIAFNYPTGGQVLIRDDSITTADELRASISNQSIECVYPLATPQTYQLTPQEALHTLYGVNNVWADIGNVSVTYPADTKMFIEKLTMPTEDDLVANQAITSGKYFMIGNSLYLALANIASGAQITIGTNAQRVSLADALNTINS